MFVYIIEKNENFKIETPFEMTDKQFRQAADYIHSILTYSNGLKLDIMTYSDRIVVESNKELIQRDNTLILREE